MRKFERPIFLGAGEHSLNLITELHNRLSDAITILGGLQQPDHPENEAHAKQCEADRLVLESDLSDAIMDLRVALGDKDVKV